MFNTRVLKDSWLSPTHKREISKEIIRSEHAGGIKNYGHKKAKIKVEKVTGIRGNIIKAVCDMSETFGQFMEPFVIG